MGLFNIFRKKEKEILKKDENKIKKLKECLIFDFDSYNNIAVSDHEQKIILSSIKDDLYIYNTKINIQKFDNGEIVFLITIINDDLNVDYQNNNYTKYPKWFIEDNIDILIGFFNKIVEDIDEKFKNEIRKEKLKSLENINI